MSFDEVKNEEMTGYSEQTFESIKHINEYGAEYWLARELSKVLDYKDFRNFELLIYKAMESCKNSGYEISDHFGEVTEMVRIGSKAQRELPSYMLSRYACYLTVMNGDPRKEVIAIGQTYFAIKTRQQEIIEDYEQLSEDQKRLATRKEIKHHNSALADAAHDAGIVRPLDYAVFQNYGYMGLYNGLKAGDIRLRKGLKKGQDILDCYEMTLVKGKIACQKQIFEQGHVRRAETIRIPALATLLYVDWLPQVNGPPGALLSSVVDHESAIIVNT